jgi:hypothetical protein
MKHKLSRISVFLGASGLLAAGLAPGAYAATSAGAGGTVKEAVAANTPSWHEVLSVGVGVGVDTVVATGRNSGWAFLSDGTAYERTGATTWKKVAFPATGGAVNVAGASSPSNVWAAFKSSSGGAELYRWNGRDWAAAESFPQWVDAISVLGPSDVWVFSAPGVFHFNGRTWTEVSATLYGGSALSDHNVWSLNGEQVEHYNGRTWTATDLTSLLPPQLPNHPASSLTNILALAPNDVYATGEGEQTPRGGPGVVLHYDGRTWTRVAEQGEFATIGGEALASDGEGGLWIAAQGFPARLPLLFHYSAGQLTAVSLGAYANSVSRIPGTAEALAGVSPSVSGNSGIVYQYS